jgi:hypothetical protein
MNELLVIHFANFIRKIQIAKGTGYIFFISYEHFRTEGQENKKTRRESGGFKLLINYR